MLKLRLLQHRLVWISLFWVTGLFTGCSSTHSYEEEARKVAAAIGADELIVHDSVSNFAVNSGRTVRFAVRGDPITSVSLSFLGVGICENGLACTNVLRRNIAYARGQSIFAGQLVQAFSPCDFSGAMNIELNNVGLKRQYQFVRANIILNWAVPPRDEARAQTELLACAQTLAAGIGNKSYPLDDTATWSARPVGLVISVGDYSHRPAATPPLIVGWKGVWQAKGRGLVMSVSIVDGQVEAREHLRDDKSPSP